MEDNSSRDALTSLVSPLNIHAIHQPARRPRSGNRNRHSRETKVQPDPKATRHLAYSPGESGNGTPPDQYNLIPETKRKPENLSLESYASFLTVIVGSFIHGTPNIKSRKKIHLTGQLLAGTMRTKKTPNGPTKG